MYTGPRGCGKTTFANIVALGLNCETEITPNPCCVCPTCKSIINRTSNAVYFIDGPKTGKIDYINKMIHEEFPYLPISGERYKVFIIDEAHALAKPSKGEEALLDATEYTPEHVYIILCTDQPENLNKATHSRFEAGILKFGRLESNYILELLEQVAQFEGMDYNPDILKYISENVDGTPRTALGRLQQINAEGSWNIETIKNLYEVGLDIDTTEIINFCRVLIRGSFRDMFKEFDKIKKTISPIECQNVIINYLTGCLKKTNNITEASKFSKAIDIMMQQYYGPKHEQFLLNSCFKISEVFNNV
jgi:DNA polymerase-3 subunit gamma/tau